MKLKKTTAPIHPSTTITYLISSIMPTTWTMKFKQIWFQHKITDQYSQQLVEFSPHTLQQYVECLFDIYL